MKKFVPLSAQAGQRIRIESLEHYKDAAIEAEAVADNALHAVADFACSSRLWEKGACEKLAALRMIADEAELRRRQARAKLLREWNDQARSAERKEDAPPWE